MDYKMDIFIILLQKTAIMAERTVLVWYLPFHRYSNRCHWKIGKLAKKGGVMDGKEYSRY